MTDEQATFSTALEQYAQAYHALMTVYDRNQVNSAVSAQVDDLYKSIWNAVDAPLPNIRAHKKKPPSPGWTVKRR